MIEYIPINDIEMLIATSLKILKNKKAMDFICKHASTIYDQKEIVGAIKKISKMKRHLVQKEAIERTDVECGES